MNQQEEDALVESCYVNNREMDSHLVRLAIRAAVAAERERAGTDQRRAHGWDAAQGLLGHAEPGTTKRYIRARDGEAVDPVEFGTTGDKNGKEQGA